MTQCPACGAAVGYRNRLRLLGLWSANRRRPMLPCEECDVLLQAGEAAYRFARYWPLTLVPTIIFDGWPFPQVSAVIARFAGVAVSYQWYAMLWVAGCAAGAWLLLPRYGGLEAISGRFCGRCHYDLSGNRSGVCPECGSQLSKPEGS